MKKYKRNFLYGMVGALLFSLPVMAMEEVAEEETPEQTMLRIFYTDTKTFLSQQEKKTFRSKGLEETLMLVEHKTAKGNLDTLPYGFVKQQIERAEQYSDAHFPEFKKRIFQDIMADLPLVEGVEVNRDLYNCTAARLMALSALELEEEEVMTKEELPEFFTQISFVGPSPYVTNLRNGLDFPWNCTDKEGQGFYNVLVHLNFEDMKGYSQAPYNCSFLNVLSPDGMVTRLDENPFIGTQTIPYGMLNNLHFIGGSLKPEVSAHGGREYKDSFSLFKHDHEHKVLWEMYRASLKEMGDVLDNIVMNSFGSIYYTALKEEESKNQDALFDFDFTLMHEDSPIADFKETMKGWTTVSPQKVFQEFATYNFPQGPTFKDLGKLIASHGYAVDLNRRGGSTDPELERYRKDMLQLLKERDVY